MDVDPIDTCPYDKAHRIRRSRMQFHITVCSKNDQDDNMKRCHYDARHVVKEKDFEKHLLNCPARDLAMKHLKDEDSTEDAPYILPVDTNQNADGWGDGEWGAEDNCQTYSPLEAIQNRPIVHAKIGLSKAQRKKHRLQERKRFNDVMEGNAANNN